MNVSVLISTYGDDGWRDLAWSHAYPSTHNQGAAEVVVHHEPGGTLSGARNAAAGEATSDWLCFVDADDELAPGYLDAMERAWMVGAITTDWAPLLVPAVDYVQGGGLTVGKASIPNHPAVDARMIDVNCAVIGTLVPRHLFVEVGGFHDEPIYEDWALWLRCMTAGARLVPVPDAVYRAAVRPDGRNQFNADAVETYRAIRAELEAAWREAMAA